MKKILVMSAVVIMLAMQSCISGEDNSVVVVEDSIVAVETVVLDSVIIPTDSVIVNIDDSAIVVE